MRRVTEARVDKLLHILPLIIAIVVASTPAQSRSLQVVGTAGYLSEWEFDGAVSETTSGGRSEFSGPLTWKHVGVCSPNGPEEKRGDIRFRLAVRCIVPDRRDGLARRRTMQLQRSFCRQLERQMDCSDAKGIPLTISIK